MLEQDGQEDWRRSATEAPNGKKTSLRGDGGHLDDFKSSHQTVDILGTVSSA